MRIFLTTILLALGVTANAGTAKLTWNHVKKDTSGAVIEINKFVVYWGLQGQPIANAINIGPPLPEVISSAGDVLTYTRTFTKPEWLPAQTICFQMTAFGMTAIESARSTQVCKRFDGPPVTPTNLIVE